MAKERIAPVCLGLTVAQFCAIEAVSLHSFYFWKRRLAAEAQSATPQDASGVAIAGLVHATKEHAS